MPNKSPSFLIFVNPPKNGKIVLSELLPTYRRSFQTMFGVRDHHNEIVVPANGFWPLRGEGFVKFETEMTLRKL